MTDPIDLPFKGPLLGIGVDMVSVSRIRDIIGRQGDRFLQKVFTEKERAYCSQFKRPYEHYAARFAAKEAIAKAFSTGIGAHLDWKSIEIVSGERGQPLVNLDQKGEVLLYQVGGNHVAISLSHTDENAIAIAAILG